MCSCLKYGCTSSKHGEGCCCEKFPDLDCCLVIGCKVALYESGHVARCKNFQSCLCLQASCGPNKHQSPCACKQVCTCVVYHCDRTSGCCDRKDNQKCQHYRIELCEHCDLLRQKAMYLKTHDSKGRRQKCECECDCYYECTGFCEQCDTHGQKGWNLLSWQTFRKPRVFTEQPQESPYYFEDLLTRQKITTCCRCKKEQIILQKFHRSCGICFDAVCLKCRVAYECEHNEVDYDENSLPYWRYEADACELSVEKHSELLSLI